MQFSLPLAAMALATMLTAARLHAADHGPVFRLATPTNPKGGWSFDLGVNGRSGTASNLEAELTYGLTPNLKVAVSGPRLVAVMRISTSSGLALAYSTSTSK